MPSHEIRFTAGQVELVGTLTLPEATTGATASDRWPAVLLLPSLLPRNRDGQYDRVGHPVAASGAGLFTPILTVAQGKSWLHGRRVRAMTEHASAL